MLSARNNCIFVFALIFAVKSPNGFFHLNFGQTNLIVYSVPFRLTVSVSKVHMRWPSHFDLRFAMLIQIAWLHNSDAGSLPLCCLHLSDAPLTKANVCRRSVHKDSTNSRIIIIISKFCLLAVRRVCVYSVPFFVKLKQQQLIEFNFSGWRAH